LSRFRCALGTAVVGLGLILAARVTQGPLETPLGTLHNPLGYVTALAFAIAAGIFLQVCSRTDDDGTDGPIAITWKLGLLALPGIGVYLFLAAAQESFVSDDYILTHQDAAHANWQQPGGDGAFRPLGQSYFDVMRVFATEQPSIWRCASLALHTVNAGLLFWLCRALWPSRKAIPALAAALFFLHASRAETVFWTAASFDLIAVLLCLVALNVWATWNGSHRGLASFCFAVIAVAAILSKESAYALPFLCSLFLLSSERTQRRAAPQLIAIASVVCVLLLAHRLLLFGGPGGYADPETGRPMIFSLNLISTAKALLARIWAVLFLPWNWESGLERLAGPLMMVYAFLWFRFAGLAATAHRYTLLALTCLTAACALPALHLLLIGSSLLGARLLYLPGIPFCMLFGMLFASGGARSHAAGMGVLAIQLFFLGHNLEAWRSAARSADAFCTVAATQEIPLEQAPQRLRGVYVLENGASECVSRKRHSPTN
jgi:hypothetical protein